MWRTLGFSALLLFLIWAGSTCFLSLFGCGSSAPKPAPPVENTEPPPPDDGSGGGSLDPYKGSEGSYRPYGTYSNQQNEIFAAFKVTISNSAASPVNGLTLVKTVDCPVKRWIHGYGPYKGLTLVASLCLEDNGKISWQCGAGTICLPLPLSDGSLLSGGSGELAQKGVCQGPVTAETTQEGYLAVLCKDKNECLPNGDTCRDATDAPWRLSLRILSKTSTTTAGGNKPYLVILEKM